MLYEETAYVEFQLYYTTSRVAVLPTNRGAFRLFHCVCRKRVRIFRHQMLWGILFPAVMTKDVECKGKNDTMMMNG